MVIGILLANFHNASAATERICPPEPMIMLGAGIARNEFKNAVISSINEPRMPGAEFALHTAGEGKRTNHIKTCNTWAYGKSSIQWRDHIDA